jgi:bifunctional lysine-specific demethylase and histidyl-hydroxylase NO66
VTLGTLDRVRAGRGPLERCTGDPRAFFTDAWGRRALVRPGAEPGGFADLLTLDDVDRFLTTTALRTPFFRLVEAGEQIPESAYTRAGRTGSREVQGIADPARVAALFERGATIVLQGLHRWSEPVARFCRDLELELGHPCQVNAYVTPPGAQGLDLHEDPHDVFVLQAFGRKRWEVHTAPREEPRAPLDAEIGAGDTIYMPAGKPHAARAQAVLSGHLTVGVHVATWREVVTGVVGRALAGRDDPVAAGWTEDTEAFAKELEGRLETVRSLLGEVDARREAEDRRERFLSNRAQIARGTVAERSAPPVITDETVVRHRPGAVCELRRRDDLLVALLGDRRLEMPAWLEPAMRRIAAAPGGFAVRELAGKLPDSAGRALLVRRLIRESLLTAAGER